MILSEWKDFWGMEPCSRSVWSVCPCVSSQVLITLPDLRQTHRPREGDSTTRQHHFSLLGGFVWRWGKGGSERVCSLLCPRPLIVTVTRQSAIMLHMRALPTLSRLPFQTTLPISLWWTLYQRLYSPVSHYLCLFKPGLDCHLVPSLAFCNTASWVCHWFSFTVFSVFFLFYIMDLLRGILTFACYVDYDLGFDHSISCCKGIFAFLVSGQFVILRQ